MKGYLGYSDSRSFLPKQDQLLGSIHFTSPEAPIKGAGGVLVLEGHLLRFIDSPVKWRVHNPLESLQELYRTHGEGFVSKLDGPFLLLFQPTPDSPIYLVNNRQQATRLYYYRQGEQLLFSGSMRELIREFKIPRRPNFGSIRSFLANGFTISDQTQLDGVRKMLPADYFIFRGGEAELKSYWPGDLRFERKKFTDLESHLDDYERRYRAGMERFFAAKKPRGVGTLLSGGHDTSFVVAQATQILKGPLQCYTVTFPGWRFNEETMARSVAEKFGAVFHAVPFGPEHVDRVVSLIAANEEPVVGSSLPLHVLAGVAADRIDTLLGGDGGDTLWGEYYPVGEYHRWVHRLPLSARKAVYSAVKGIRRVSDWERLWELEHVAGLFAEPGYHQDFLRKLCTYRHFDDAFQQSILKPEIFSSPYSRSHLEIEFRDDNFSDALIEGKLYNGFLTYQAFHTTKIAEYHGMDLFLPTIDKEFMDLICELPRNWVNGGTTFHRLTNNKRINRRFHKKALSRYLGRDEIYNRSFDIPWYNILRPRKALMEKLLQRLLARGWYNESALNTLFSEFMTQSVKDDELLELKHHGYRIFTLLSLEVWCLEYLDGRFSAEDKNLVLEEYLA